MAVFGPSPVLVACKDPICLLPVVCKTHILSDELDRCVSSAVLRERESHRVPKSDTILMLLISKKMSNNPMVQQNSIVLIVLVNIQQMDIQ